MVPNIQRCDFSETNNLLKVCLFDKKKQITECVLDIEDIEKYIGRINKSKLVVFNVKEKDKNVLISVLSNLNNSRKRYSPIVEVGDNKIFFFPQLNYSDLYLLKALFQQEYVNDIISINLGKNERI